MALEGLVLDSLDLDDGTTYRIVESLDVNPPSKRMLWIAGREGDILGDVPGQERRTVTFKVMVTGSTMDVALTALGALTDKLQKAERTNGGISLVWTPSGSSYSKTIKVLAGEITDLPLSPDALYFRNHPVVTVRLDCKPFLYGTETSYATVTSSAPHVVAMARSVAGDVAAEGRLILTDMATQERDFAEYGLDASPQTYEGLALSYVPSLFLRLSSLNGAGLTDQSNGVHNATGGGGVTIGGYSTNLPLVGDDSSATDLDGVNDLINVSGYTPFVAGTARTFSGWAYRDATANADALFSGNTSGTQPLLYLTGATGDIDFYGNVGGAAVSWASAWPGATQWVHWVLTFDDTTQLAELWINGISQGGRTASHYHATPGNLLFGVSGSGVLAPFDGKMAQLGVWESILTNDQIRQLYHSGANPYLFDSIYLSTTGLAGTGSTRSGAYSPVGSGNTVQRVTTQTNWVGVAETGALPHYGPFRAKIRCYTDATDAQVRVGYKAGDAPFKRLDPKVLPYGLVSQWQEVDLGMIDIPQATLGTQRTIVRVEVKSTTSNKTFDLDYLELIPATRYGKARAPMTPIPTSSAFSAVTGFDTESGAITGDSLAIGGTWTGAGDADDFTVASGVATRTAVSDSASYNGRFITASSPTLTNLGVQVDFKVSRVDLGAAQYLGLLARFTSTTNTSFLRVIPDYNEGTQLGLFEITGTGSVSEYGPQVVTGPVVADAWYTLTLVIFANGAYAASLRPQGGSFVAQLTGANTQLATGGTQASGKVGIFDSSTSATASTRTYDNFTAWVPETDAAIFSGKTLEFRYDDTLRQDSGGTIYGRPSVARGPGVFIPQAGSESKVTRIVAKAARNDIEIGPRDNIADSTKLEVYATPRYLVTPR